MSFDPYTLSDDYLRWALRYDLQVRRAGVHAIIGSSFIDCWDKDGRLPSEWTVEPK